MLEITLVWEFSAWIIKSPTSCGSHHQQSVPICVNWTRDSGAEESPPHGVYLVRLVHPLLSMEVVPAPPVSATNLGTGFSSDNGKSKAVQDLLRLLRHEEGSHVRPSHVLSRVLGVSQLPLPWANK